MSRTIDASAKGRKSLRRIRPDLLLGFVLVVLAVPATGQPRGPWVAVVDWDDAHGRSISQIIRQASGGKVETRLFALEGNESSGERPEANDEAVLIQLRRVAEAAKHQAPLAVNLSFGRLHAPLEGHDRHAAAQIGDVLRFLRHDLGIPVFAAAGHQGQLLYPAADPSVTAVGTLDLGQMAATGRIRPLAGTPRGVGALFPGQGLFLEESGSGRTGPGRVRPDRVRPDRVRPDRVRPDRVRPDRVRPDRIRPMPPGSSYASALAAGWWATYRIHFPRLAAKLFGYCRDVLSPRRQPGGRFALACGAKTLPGSAFEAPVALVATALGERPEVCEAMARRSREVRRLDVLDIATDVPERTLAEIRPGLSHPMPESRPCVPCHGSGGGGDNSSGGEVWWPSAGGKATVELSVDLSASEGIGPGLELLGLFLEVDGRLLRFSDSENRTLLGEIALGRIDQLRLHDVPDPTGAASLVFVLRLTKDGPVFRSSSPILIHEH